MASASWTQDDLPVGSIPSNEARKDVCLELLPAEAAQRGANGPIAFPYSPLQISSLSMENLYGPPRSLSNAGMHDLNLKPDVGAFYNYPMDPAFYQRIMIDNVDPFLGYQVPSFPGVGVNRAMSSGCQTNLMSNHGMDGPNRDRNFIEPYSSEARNFHMPRSDEQPMNNTSQMADTSRSLSNFSTALEFPCKPDFIQRAHDNQVRLNEPQLDHLNKLDGRFLSLGYQSNSVFDSQPDAYGRTSFSYYSQLANNSLNMLSVRPSGFGDNVGGFRTQGYSNNLNLPCTDPSALHVLNSGFDGHPGLVLPRGEINMQHFIPTPSSGSSGLGNGIGLKFSSLVPSQGCGANQAIFSNVPVSKLGLPGAMQRMTHRMPFNSSVPRNNHQNAYDQTKISYLRTAMESHLFDETSTQDQSGQAYPLNTSQDLNSTDQGSIFVESGLSHPSATFDRRSLKRSSPPLSSAPEQQKKIRPHTSTYPSSPYLVQNALGHVGQSIPAFTTCANPSLIATAAMKGFAASNSVKQTTLSTSASTTGAPFAIARTSVHPTASAEAFISPAHVPATYSSSEEISLGFPTSAMNYPAVPANIPSISVVPAEGRMLLPPPIAKSAAYARTVADRTCSARVPVNAYPCKMVKPQTFPSSPHSPASAAASHKILPDTNSGQTPPGVSSIRKRFPALAALAKASPAYRTAQFPSSASHIKWQGFDIRQPLGEKCLLCKRDLSYNPEGPISLPPIAPPVAVLPCGHTFHDDCLSRITPADQAKDPPCIPCAIDEK